jgi:hypothetical protein
MSDTNTGWRKRQIALDIKAENARELGLDYEPSMTKDEALKLTLEALESADWYIDQLEMLVYSDDGTHETRAKVQVAITAIKTALAQRTWVGLTAEEIEAIGKPYEEKDRSIQAWGLFACAIEQALKEQNT